MKAAHDIWGVLKEIADKSSDGEYAFRGQARAKWEIQSTLYRVLKKLGKDVGPEGAEIHNINEVQSHIMQTGKEYTDLPEHEILPNIQHYGGQTNLIDFTSDFHIALFFACDGCFSRRGKVFLLRKDNKKKWDFYDSKSPSNRVIAQKGIFVQPDGGVLEPDKTVLIRANLKKDILNYLRRCHGISSKTLYNDLHGYLKHRGMHHESDKKVYKGLLFPSASKRDRMKLYNSAIEKNPNAHEAYYARSFVRKADDLPGSESDLTEAIKISPNSDSYYYARSLIRENRGDLQGTESDLTEAIKINPNSDRHYYARSLIRENRGDLQGAESDRTEAIKINPNDDGYYYARSLIRQGKGDFLGAESDLTEAIKINPNNDACYYARSLIRKDKNDLQGAESDLTKAIKINPDYGGYYYARSLIRNKTGDSQGAKSDLTKSKKLSVASKKRGK